VLTAKTRVQIVLAGVVHARVAGDVVIAGYALPVDVLPRFE
jgi:hypothetical protein